MVHAAATSVPARRSDVAGHVAELDLSSYDRRSLRDSHTGDLRASVLRSRVRRTATPPY